MLVQRHSTIERLMGSAIVWLILLTCFGFEIQMGIAGLLRIPSTPINILFRFSYLLLSLVLIFAAVLINKPTRRHYSSYAIIVFWILYSIRLIYDMQVRDIWFMHNQSLLVYQFAFGATLIPTIAAFMCAKYVRLENFNLKLFSVLFLGNLLTIFLLIGRHGFSTDLFQQVTTTGFENEDGSLSASLNYIAISLYGALLFASSSMILLVKKRLIGFRLKLLYYFGGLLGLTNVLLGASRGVGLIVVFVIIPYLIRIYVKTNRISFEWIYIRVIKMSFLLPVILYWLYSTINTDNLLVLKRLELTLRKIENGEGDSRIRMWSSAIEQFVNNPLLGDKFVNNANNNHTAHNFFLEIPMSLGFVGIVIFMIILNGLRKQIVSSKVSLSPIGIAIFMLLIWMANAMTSGSIWGWSAIWILLAFILSIPRQTIDERIMDYSR